MTGQDRSKQPEHTHTHTQLFLHKQDRGKGRHTIKAVNKTIFFVLTIDKTLWERKFLPRLPPCIQSLKVWLVMKPFNLKKVKGRDKSRLVKPRTESTQMHIWYCDCHIQNT